MSVSSGLVNGLLVTLGSLNGDTKFEAVYSRFKDGVATVQVRVNNVQCFSGTGSDDDPEQARCKAIKDALKQSGYQTP